VELPYTDIPGGRALVSQLKPADTMADVRAAIAAAAAVGGAVGLVGFCWGGTVAYLGAASLPIQAAVAYYGGMIGQFLDRVPRVPTLYHFGERDAHIPLETVRSIQNAHPAGQYHLYPAGHGFNCDERADYEPASAALAWSRSLEFLRTHLSGGHGTP
jgi:carboxymethylenebutenolidase